MENSNKTKELKLNIKPTSFPWMNVMENSSEIYVLAGFGPGGSFAAAPYFLHSFRRAIDLDTFILSILKVLML